MVSERRILWPDSYRDFAPRLGAAYRLTGDGRTVLRAGGGLYYNSSLSIATDTINSGPLGIAQFGGAVQGIFPSVLSFGFEPNLKLPEVTQWNLSLERAWTGHDVLSVSYLGSAGRDLIRREVGGDGNTFTNWVALTTNRGRSDYNALRWSTAAAWGRAWKPRASYAWSHSIDNDSSDAFLVWAGSVSQDRGSSDFDVRHSLTAALTYGYTAPEAAHGLARLANGWDLDAILRARSGFPITCCRCRRVHGDHAHERVPAQPGSRPAAVDRRPHRAGAPAAQPGGFHGRAIRAAGQPGPQRPHRFRNVPTGSGVAPRVPAGRAGEGSRFAWKPSTRSTSPISPTRCAI